MLPRIEQPVVVGEGHLATVTIAIPPGGEVVGTFVDAAGAPVAGAGVEVGGIRAKTDGEGRFRVAWAPEGRQRVWSLPGRGRVALGHVEVPAGGIGRADIRGGPSGLTLRLLRGETPVPSGLVSLSKAADGSLGSGSVGSGSVGSGSVADGSVAEGRPDAHGRVAIPHLAPGSYDMMAWAGTGPVLRRRLEVGVEALDLGDVTFPESLDIPLDLVLPANAPRLTLLTTYVRAPGAERPLPDLGSRAEVDGAGRWTLRGLPEGDYDVTFLAPGYGSVTQRVAVRRGTTVPVRVVLSPP